MFVRFLNIIKGFMKFLISKHFEYYLKTAKIDMDTMLFIKKLSNQLFTYYSFPI